MEVGPVKLPRDPHRTLDEIAFHPGSRFHVGGPVVEPLLIGLGILVRQDDRPGTRPEAVLEGVELDIVLALFGPGPGALLGVSPVGSSFRCEIMMRLPVEVDVKTDHGRRFSGCLA